MTSKPGESYIHGHHPSVLRSHSWRTLQNSAAYLLPHLPTSPSTILDAGCGPGTITCDLASRLPNAQVTGIDYHLLPSCTALAESKGLKNIYFQEADIFKLPFEDNTFDVVHLHQVLQHLPTPPTGAIRELLRVTKPGGVIAARDADFGSFTWFPENEGLDKWLKTYIETARGSGSDPFAGRKLQKWFMDAGVRRADISCSSSCWTYSTPEERGWWGGMWAERSVKSSFAEMAAKNGVTQEELDGFSEAWKKWAGEEEGWIMVPSGEVIVKVNKA